jgi:hypothetical protein
VDLEEILALDNEHVRAKEAEVLATLTELTGPARRQFEGAKRDYGHVAPPELLTVFIDPVNQEMARQTIKVCIGSLFDVYAHTAFQFVLDPEPFIELLTPIGERVRLKLGVIAKDELEVLKLRWEGLAWQRGRPTGLRRLLKWLLAFANKPVPKTGPGAIEPKPQGVTGGAADVSRPIQANSGGGRAQSGETPPDGLATVVNLIPENERLEETCIAGDPSTSAPAAGATISPGADRAAMVDDFLLRCNQEPGLPERLFKKHIWASAGHKSPRQFQYWQAGDAAATAEDEKNFGRILAMSPSAFIAQLKRSNLISDKS